MAQELSPASILAARAELPEYTLELANDFFSYTWQASHIRLVELAPDAGDTKLFVLLAHVLTRNPAGEFLVQEWLPNTRIQRADPDDLAEAIGMALEDINEAADRPNVLLSDALTHLSIQDAWPIYTIATDDPELPEPRSAYEYGPTYQYFWISGRRFYYLEIHHES